MRHVRRDLQQRIVDRLRDGDRIRLAGKKTGGSIRLRLTFGDGEVVHSNSLESLVRRGEVQIDDDGEVKLR